MTVGTVTPIRQDSCTVTIGTAIGAFLATIGRPESRGTHRQYAATLRRFRDRFGAGTGPGAPGDEEIRAWIEETWASGRRPPTTGRSTCSAPRSATGRAGLARHRSHPAAAAPPDPPDRARALSRAGIESLLARNDVGLREKTLWRMLYETAARAGEVLALNIEDLDSPTAARRSAARAARSTSSSGRPAPPACCPA